MATNLTTKALSPTVVVKIVHDAQSHIIPIVAILAGILGTLLGVWLGHYLSNRREEVKDRRQTLSSLKAIQAEIRAIWAAYMKGPGKDIEGRISATAKRPLGRYPAVPDSFFTVYGKNAQVLGKLGDDRLTESVVLAYQRMIGLFEAIGLNNEFHKEATETEESFGMVSGPTRLNALADELEERHQQIKLEMEKLFDQIEKYLEKNRKC